MSTSEQNMTPDVDRFKKRYPAFTFVDNSLVDMIICEMEMQIGPADRWCGSNFTTAILYLTAHHLTMQGEPERSNAVAEAEGQDVSTIGGPQTGAVEKVKVGDVETTFDTKTSARGQLDAQSLRNLVGDQIDYSLTHYGRLYLKLRQKNFGGPRVFSCP